MNYPALADGVVHQDYLILRSICYPNRKIMRSEGGWLISLVQVVIEQVRGLAQEIRVKWRISTRIPWIVCPRRLL
jgi:hypothetical protein